MEADERERARQRWIVFGLTVAVAATRILALSRSLWNWDESLFCIALHHFDVGAHHPHPPGFPLYIALGKLLRLVIPDDFRALRTVQFIASMFIFPSFYAMARAMRVPFTLAVSAGLLFAFLPNVWFYGGTAWSDILSIVLFLAGAAFLFAERDPRSTSLYLLGTALFSLSLLVRPQNVLMAFPWFVATWPRLRARRYGTIAAAALLSIAIVGIGYGIAAKVTGPATWWAAVRSHEQYVSHVDGFLNPRREAFGDAFTEFVIDPFEGGAGPRLLFAFAVAALFRPRRRDVEALATFAPFLLLAVLMLNTTGTSRLSIGFLPLLVLLAVDGMAFIGETFARSLRSPRLAPAIVIVIALLLGVRFITWAMPALRVVRRGPSPPVEAVEWIRANVPPGATIYAGGGLPPIAEYYLPGYDLRFVENDKEAMKSPARNAWYIGDGPTGNAEAVHFTRPRKKLWALFTRRYFEVDVHPLSGAVRYLSGWYDAEQNESGGEWRWMGTDGRVALQPLPHGGELRFSAMFPLDHEPPPQVTVRVDGAVLDSFVASQAFVARRYELGPSATWHDVAFHVSNTVNLQRLHLNNDARNLGMQLDAISWRP